MSEIPSLRSSLLTGVLSRDFQLPQTTSAQGASMAPREYPFSDVWTGSSRGSKLEQTQGLAYLVSSPPRIIVLCFPVIECETHHFIYFVCI